ncbi:MAG: phenylalanine--tRNA ligase subunit alpha [Nitrosopumilus sp.]|nr:phenylalanine--tRNA ligase subunit alpha [Nitrosopumilus sp.]
MVLHDIERRMLGALGSPSDPDRICEETGLSPDQVRRGMEWLRHKGLADISEERTEVVSLGRNGLEALKKGMPERRLAELLGAGPMEMSRVQEELGAAFGPAVGRARKSGWLSSKGGMISLSGRPGDIPGEEALAAIGAKSVPRGSVPGIEPLLDRPGFVVAGHESSYLISITDAGREAAASRGEGGAIDVEADAPRVFAARRHPLREVMSEVREAFVALGFEEVRGPQVQSSFWNFDALFTPQDHPARELQDTFYLDGMGPGGDIATAEQKKRITTSHRKGWRYEWDEGESRRMLLRTHTTCVTVRHLADGAGDGRFFSLGRVFRNEKPSYRHLAEFHQVEGVVAEKDASLRGLMGIQREFYRRMGLPRVRFWPTYFPYTEPSLQSMVYDEGRKKWVELFGMGVFRPEVTRPLGISRPVLAWGGGLERVAMLKLGVDDVREFYGNSLGWLRCR